MKKFIGFLTLDATQVGLIVFLIGSILCGTAESITQLSIYRAIQGIGGSLQFHHTNVYVGAHSYSSGVYCSDDDEQGKIGFIYRTSTG